MERTFCISDDLFGGFKTQIDIVAFPIIEQIIEEVRRKLGATLASLNLGNLVVKLEKMSLHVHDIVIDDIFNSAENDIFWICNHEHGGDTWKKIQNMPLSLGVTRMGAGVIANYLITRYSSRLNGLVSYLVKWSKVDVLDKLPEIMGKSS
tara:strand:+ start:341 stop:790 length:450 start_codon:yes stop_codon:yes gene_type:complete